MPALSDYLKNKLADLIFRGGTFATPPGLYIALFTAAPTAAGGGIEVTGGSYARAALAPTPTNWAATNGVGSTTAASSGTSGTTSNNVLVTFATPTGDWGTIVAIGVMDAATGGNLLVFGAIASPAVISSGVAPTIAAAAFDVSLS